MAMTPPSPPPIRDGALVLILPAPARPRGQRVSLPSALAVLLPSQPSTPQTPDRRTEAATTPGPHLRHLPRSLLRGATLVPRQLAEPERITGRGPSHRIAPI